MFMRILRKLLEQIDITNRRHKLFKSGDALLLAVSGGPDSMALLHLFSRLKRKYALKLFVAHLDHGLRGAESRKHGALVRRVCEELRIPFYSKSVNVKALSRKSGRSLEETGRTERYRFFRKAAGRTGSSAIVTGHTLDDQAETVLMRFLRGAGLRGLSGIPYKRMEGRRQVIRPLLDCDKKDLLIFLRKNRLHYGSDSTNRSVKFTRNRIRHKLFPEISKFYNPRIKASLAGLQAVCRRAQDYIEHQARKAFTLSVHGKPRRGKVSFKLAKLKRLHPAILTEVLFQGLRESKGDLRRFGTSHVEAILELLDSKEPSLEIHLPGPIKVSKTTDCLLFS